MFEKYLDWKILRFFLHSPDQSYYTKDIARRLNVSPGSVNSFLRALHEDNLLHKEVIGNVHLYKLNNDNLITRQLKIIDTLLQLQRLKITDLLLEGNDTILSIILYGSHANGENDAKSDLDILLILQEKKPLTPLIQRLEKTLGKPISIQMLTPPDWETLKEKDKIFHDSILAKHIVLQGGELS